MTQHTRAAWSKRELRKIKSKLAEKYGHGPRAQSKIESDMLEIKTAPGDARARLRMKFEL